MLDYNEIRERKYIVYEGDPYEVMESSIKKKNRQKPANQTKLKHLISGAVKQVAFHQSDVVEEADISKKTVIYSFKKQNNQTKKTEYWFHEEGNRSERFFLPEESVIDQIMYMKENSSIDALTWNDNIIGIKLPVKVDLKVVEAPPNFKGNTASGADKKVVLETGAMVTVPMFIKTGDIIRINTDSNTYVERV